MDTRPSQEIATHIERGDSISLADIFQQLSGFVRRQLPIFIFVLGCAAALGGIYLFTTPPRYTAHTFLVIDSSKMRFLQQQQTPLADVPLDTAQVETQVELLKSDNLGLAVIKDQRLTEHHEFMNAGGGFIGGALELITGLFGKSEPESDAALTRKALALFKSQRSITRVGRTYVLDIAYTALSPHHAASISNAIADAYIVDQLESKYQATKRASTWLQERIKELRLQASVADVAVIEYKEKNKIIDVGGSSAVGGTGARLLGDQQLAELSTQLGNARALTAEAKAKLDRIQDVMKQSIPDAGVTDSLKNDVINRLRNQYLDFSAKQAIWSARYGANHLAAVNLRTQMSEIAKSIRDELGRIAESYKSDYEIAKSRQEDLEKGYAGLVTTAQATNRDRLGLRDLESNAQVYHSIYENFLQRYMEAIQQQSFPITEARVISTASPPTGKSGPLASMVLAIAGALGLVISVGIAGLREAADRVFRTTRQVEQMLNTNCLAVLPLLKKTALVVRDTKHVTKPTPWQQAIDGSQKVRVSHDNRILRHVIDEPLSLFAEALRSIKIAADINGTIRDNKVIGLTSTLPREGKSTIAANLAQLIAHAGKRVILLDLDLRNPTLTRSLAPTAKAGLLQVLGNEIQLGQAVLTDDTRLVFLPAVIESRLAHTSEILASEALKRLLTALRQSHDYVVLDLPPLAPVVDVRAAANLIDSIVFVIEWGSTQMNLIQNKLAAAPEIYDRLLGAVLNKANVSVLERYEYYYGTKYYARYGYPYNQ